MMILDDSEDEACSKTDAAAAHQADTANACT